MLLNCLLVALSLGMATSASSSGLRVMFPEQNRQYSFVVKTNSSSGILAPREGNSFWTLEGRLSVTVYDNYTKVRFKLDDLKTSYQSEEAASYLKKTWEAEYQGNGFITAIYVGDEPKWATNMKRALTINFQLKKDTGTYGHYEPCLYESCLMVYTGMGSSVKKYCSLKVTSDKTEHSWSSVPWTEDYVERNVPEVVSTSERVYELDEKRGLSWMNMNGNFQYKIHDHVLYVASELSLYYDMDAPVGTIEKLDLYRRKIQYDAGDYRNPSNFIKIETQDNLRNKTYDIVIKIAKKGIDADSIVKNEGLIHTMDFVDLLNTMSQLNYESYTILFDELIVGTSYDLETARNIFLEVLPHGRSDACARFIRYLITDQKEKIEDAVLLSLLHKLPYNVADYSQSLLEELEVFTRLGLDFPPSIRHAGVLSFATIASKTMDASLVKSDYYDNIVIKYFRMHSECPLYLDRMVWLQGLCTLGYGAEHYIRSIQADVTRNHHERLWASMACGLETKGYMVLETALPILTNDKEHIQLRIAALHALLSSNISASDFLFIHNYIKGCSSDQLKRFWYSTVKTLEKNRFFHGYKAASSYVPFIINQVSNPGSAYWATNNLVFSVGDDEDTASVHFFSVGEAYGPMPAMGGIKLSTGGRRPFQPSIYFIAEGLSWVFMKMLLQSRNVTEGDLISMLEKLNAWKLRTPEPVHIDIVMKIDDKTMYAMHIDQYLLVHSYNELLKLIDDFLKYGSHINQQMVYYPFQMDWNIASELGTPVRLQRTIVGFLSVRGNLTASPDKKRPTWMNDLQIIYQGTAVTSLSTDGPILLSEHTTRIQQSIVALLPMTFNISYPLPERKIQLTLLFPFTQRAGLALDSRVLVNMVTVDGNFENVVITGSDTCERDEVQSITEEQTLSGAETTDKLITHVFDLLTPLRSSHVALDSVLLLNFPPSGTCGATIFVSSLRNYGEGKVVLDLGVGKWDFLREEDKIDVDFNFTVSFYILKQNREDPIIKIYSETNVKSQDGNLTAELAIRGKLPDTFHNISDRYIRLCYLQEVSTQTAADQDQYSYPSSYKGQVVLLLDFSKEYRTCHDRADNKLKINYKGTPKTINGALERHVEFEIDGKQGIDLVRHLLPKRALETATELFSGRYDKDSVNAVAEMKEKNGVIHVKAKDGNEVKFKSDNLGWILDSFTTMRLMTKYGLYRECRLQESTVETLFGTTEQLLPLQQTDAIALADCSEFSSFAVLRQPNGGVKVHAGGNSVVVRGDAANITAAVPHFRIRTIGDGVKVSSLITGVTVYVRRYETVILVPHSYVDALCGECVGRTVYAAYT